jgi:hydrogenase maturation protein HypF
MKLEKYLAMGEPKYSFDIDIKNGVVGTVDLFKQLDDMISKSLTEKDKADYAYSLVNAVMGGLSSVAIENAEKEGIKSIGLSGGVSYNIPITEMVEKQVNKAGLELVVHNHVPNGDGGIAIGQNVIVGNKLKG